MFLAERLGYCERNELLKKLNNEKNTPLHSAVSSGDIKVFIKLMVIEYSPN